jgi:hypothetical protein
MIEKKKIRIIVSVLKQILKMRNKISFELEILSKANRLRIFFIFFSVIVMKHVIVVE